LTTTIIVPCYNEASRFQAQAFRDYLAHPSNVRFIFVNDGSKDGTLPMLQELRAKFPDLIEVFDRGTNGGKGEAVRTGILQALQQSSGVVGFWDADLATPLDAIADLARVMEANPDIQMVFGSRVKLMGRDIERKRSRHYLGRVFATVVSGLLRLPVYDTQCGAKLFRSGPEMERLFAEPFNSRWVFDVEILARFIRARGGDIDSVRKSIYEFPLQAWRDVAGSKLRSKDFVRAFMDVIRIHLKYRI
jgi:glycosyltransferase involved in cell wall biosynthesis